MPLARQFGGQLDETRQNRWQLDPRELRPAVVLDGDRQVLAAIGNVRERVARVEGERRQHRGDVAPEVLGDKRCDVFRVLGRFEKPDAVLRQLRPQTIVPAASLLVEHLTRPRPHQPKLLLGRQSIRRHVLAVRPHLLLEHRDANHEELVEVGADNGEKLDAFEERVAAIACLIEHPLVELQPAELAIDKEGRGVERRRDCGHGTGIVLPVCKQHVTDESTVVSRRSVESSVRVVES